MNELGKTPFLHKKPSSLRYYQEGVPAVGATEWCLRIDDGRRSVALTYDDIIRLPVTQQHRRMVCVCSWTIKRYWSGVLLADLLRHVGIDTQELPFLRQASVGTAEKGVYESWIEVSGALRRGALLAHTVDGEPLPPAQGAPLRLIDFGLYGYKCVKGLAKLELTHEARLGYWEEQAGYMLDGTVKPKRYYAVDLQKQMFSMSAGEVTEW